MNRRGCLSFGIYCLRLTGLVGLQRIADIKGLVQIRRRILFPVRQTSLVALARIRFVGHSGDDGLVLEESAPAFGEALHESDGLASQLALGLAAVKVSSGRPIVVISRSKSPTGE